jgi:hypothetical protein
MDFVRIILRDLGRNRRRTTMTITSIRAVAQRCLRLGVAGRLRVRGGQNAGAMK